MGDEASGFTPISRTLLASICVFGADGNLASKKILPTIFNLWKRRLMPRDLLIFGYARAQMTTEQFRKTVFRCIYNPTQPQSDRKEFLQRCHYVYGQFDDNAAIAELQQAMEHAELQRLKERMSSGGSASTSSTAEPTKTEQVRMYYMAVPPFLYASICGALRSRSDSGSSPSGGGGASDGSSISGGGGGSAAQAELAAMGVRTVERFVLEKPFGRDTESCAQVCRIARRTHRLPTTCPPPAHHLPTTGVARSCPSAVPPRRVAPSRWCATCRCSRRTRSTASTIISARSS